MTLDDNLHLELTFKLKDGFQEDFAKNNPNPELDKLRDLLKEFGAEINVWGYNICHEKNHSDDGLGSLKKALSDHFNKEKNKDFERTVRIKLNDERNLKTLYINLWDKQFNDIIEFGSVEVDAGGYSTYMGSMDMKTLEFTEEPRKIIPPPFPPEKSEIKFKHEPD